MNGSSHRGRLLVVAALVVGVAGCARDGAYEPRGSIKDTPAAAPGRGAEAATATVRRPRIPPRPRGIVQGARRSVDAPRHAEAPTVAPVLTQPQQPKRIVETPAVPPALTPPPRTSSPQPVPVSQAPLQPGRRLPMGGAQLLDEGRLLFRAGEVLAARERYVAALSAPLPEVLLELGRTYDPNYLDRLPRSDADADLERARALYEQSVALGSKAAEADLARLQGGAPPR